jgi:DNA-binding HxlR family transcriptional regulator
MSPSVLYQRLGELTESGLVTQAEDSRYELTALGGELGEALEPLTEWSRRWAQAGRWLPARVAVTSTVA